MQYEQWKDIKGYEGHYQISDQGRVKSFKWGKERILKGGTTKPGYRVVVLVNDGRHFSCSVHSLVASTFIRERYDGEVVMHLNHDKTDNRLENLQIGTYQENSEASTLAGHYKGHQRPYGQNNGRSKLTEGKVREIRALQGTVTIEELADRYGVTFQSISCIHRRKTWKHVD